MIYPISFSISFLNIQVLAQDINGFTGFKRSYLLS